MIHNALFSSLQPRYHQHADLWGAARRCLSCPGACYFPMGKARNATLAMAYMVVVFFMFVLGLTLGKLARRFYPDRHERDETWLLRTAEGDLPLVIGKLWNGAGSMLWMSRQAFSASKTEGFLFPAFLVSFFLD